MRTIVLFILLGILFAACTQGGEIQMTSKTSNTIELATFSGGCFWCSEQHFEEVEGVIEVVSGFSGGEEVDPSYQAVASGQTTHREAIQVTYDPKNVSYEQLVEIFWTHVNPTDAGGQFADRGNQYSTAIYYHNQEQKKIAEKSLKALNESGKFEEPIVTLIEPFNVFYPAEEYHQDFSKKHPLRYKLYKAGSGRTGYVEETWGEK